MTFKKPGNKKLVIFIAFYLLMLVGGFFYYMAGSRVFFTSDALFYDKAGFNISKGEGYSIDGRPTAEYQIGYPLFLAGIYSIFGHNYKIAIAIQAFISLLTFILFLILSAKLNKSLYFISVLLYFCNYTFVMFPYLILSETLALLLFSLCAYLLYIFLETRKIFIVFLLGILYGCLTLVRPVFQLYPLLLLLFFLFFLKKYGYKIFFTFLAFFFCFIIVIAPYSYRNYKKFGIIQLSALGSFALYQGMTHKQVDWSQFNNGKKISYSDIASSRNIPAADKVMIAKTLNSIKIHPFKTFFIYLENVNRLLFYSFFEKPNLHPQRIFLVFLNILSCVAAFFGLYFVFTKKTGFEKNRGQILAFYYSMLFYYVMISSLFVIEPRYGVYPMFLLYLLAPIAFGMRGRPLH